MSRPIGSKNKPKTPSNKNGVYLTNLEKQIEGSAVTRKNALGWVNWGIKNTYPNILLDLFNQSPTHRSAVNFAVQSILGNGVDFEQMGVNGDEVVPNYAQTWDEVIKSLALDYILYGSYARTINFTLYPNDREFATVADMEAYGYAWEGMTAYVGDTNYEYKNGEWVEYSGTMEL